MVPDASRMVATSTRRPRSVGFGPLERRDWHELGTGMDRTNDVMHFVEAPK